MTNTVLLNKTDKTARKTETTPHLSVPACDHACTNKWGVFLHRRECQTQGKADTRCLAFPSGTWGTSSRPDLRHTEKVPPGYPRRHRGTPRSRPATRRTSGIHPPPPQAQGKALLGVARVKSDATPQGLRAKRKGLLSCTDSRPFRKPERSARKKLPNRPLRASPPRFMGAHAPIWFTARRRR